MSVTVRVLVRRNDLPLTEERVRDFAGELVGWIGDLVYRVSQEEVPVDQDVLRPSAEIVKTGDLSLEVRYDARNVSGHNYGFYQEYGTRHHPAQPYLVPAAFRAAEQVPDEAQRIYGRLG